VIVADARPQIEDEIFELPVELRVAGGHDPRIRFGGHGRHGAHDEAEDGQRSGTLGTA
jgi:hypothetical protein